MFATFEYVTLAFDDSFEKITYFHHLHEISCFGRQSLRIG